MARKKVTEKGGRFIFASVYLPRPPGPGREVSDEGGRVHLSKVPRARPESEPDPLSLKIGCGICEEGFKEERDRSSFGREL